MIDKKRLITNIKLQICNLSPVIIFVMLFVIFAVLNITISGSSFLTLSNLSTIINQASYLCFLGVAQMMVVLIGGIDLSIGSVMVFTTIVCGGMLIENSSMPAFVGPILMLLMGAGIGLFNGLLVVKLRIPSFIATFGTMYILRGTAWLIAGRNVYHRIKPSLRSLTQATIVSANGLKVTSAVLLCIAVVAFFTFLTCKTTLGKKIYFIGSNVTVAKFSGLPTDKISILVYMICSAMAAMCGLIYATRVNSCDASMYTSAHFDAVCVAILGGASLAGGFGKIWGCIFGALIIATIQNGMNMLKISSELQTLVLGIFLIVAVCLNQKLTQERMLLESGMTGKKKKSEDEN